MRSGQFLRISEILGAAVLTKRHAFGTITTTRGTRFCIVPAWDVPGTKIVPGWTRDSEDRRIFL